MRALAVLLATLAPLAHAQEVRLDLPAGTDPALEQTLRNASLTLQLDPAEAAAQDYVAAARADYRRLLTGLYAEGHYGGTISITVDGRETDAIQPLDAPVPVGVVRIAVDPGPLFAFGRVGVGPLAEGTLLPPAFAPGEPARSEVVRDATAAAIGGWRDRGHALAAVEGQDIRAVHPGDVLDVAVAIAPGPRLTFGDVAVTGAERVREARIRAIAGIPQGQVFAPDELERAATRLRRTGAFDSVALVEGTAPGPGGTLPVTVQVVESLPRRIGVSGELSSLDGLSLNAFWLHRNLLGGAERLRFDASVTGIEGGVVDGAAGGPDYSLGVEFGRPATFSPDTDLSLRASLAVIDDAAFQSREARLGALLTRYASATRTLTFGPELLASREEAEGVETRFTLLTFPLTLTEDRRDDRLDARAGFYLRAEATPFVSLGGDGETGARLYADGRLYRALGSRFVLAARGQVGSVVGAGADAAPQQFLFTAGGSATVRGVPYRSVGIESGPPPPDILGGASLVGVQIEARAQVRGRIGAVAFADAAIVGFDSLPDDDSLWAAGVGVGARYSTPIGPIRLDLATPATGDDAFSDWQIYLGIGQAF